MTEAKTGMTAVGDSDYKFGVIYFNTTDPRIVVPKKIGIGWTLNMGHPAGQLLAVLTVGALVAPKFLNHRKADNSTKIKKHLKKIKKLAKK